jgi:hypothetical protein
MNDFALFSPELFLVASKIRRSSCNSKQVSEFFHTIFFIADESYCFVWNGVELPVFIGELSETQIENFQRNSLKQFKPKNAYHKKLQIFIHSIKMWYNAFFAIEL